MQAYTGNAIRFEERFWDVPKIESYAERTGRPDPLSDGTMTAVFFRGADFHSEETRVFAYLGFPEGADESDRVPGVVLVHGGGGTAFKEWVREWTGRGYAAVAIDYQGNMPLADCKIDSNLYEEIPGFSAPKNLNFADGDEPVRDQWMYFATSAAILANSLIRSCPQVDETRVGIAGISWGSIVASIAIGYDDRFAFACPIYGALYNSENHTYLGEAYRTHRGAMIWDDDAPFLACRIPTQITALDNDTNFSIDVCSKSCLALWDGILSIRSGEEWWHSHTGGVAAAEPYAFADSVCKGAPGLVRITSQPSPDRLEIGFDVPAGVTVSHFELVWSADAALDGTAVWHRETAETLERLPSLLGTGAKQCYLNVVDSRGLVSSSALCRLV